MLVVEYFWREADEDSELYPVRSVPVEWYDSHMRFLFDDSDAVCVAGLSEEIAKGVRQTGVAYVALKDSGEHRDYRTALNRYAEHYEGPVRDLSVVAIGVNRETMTSVAGHPQWMISTLEEALRDS